MAQKRVTSEQGNRKKIKRKLQAYMVQPFLICLILFVIANLLFPNKKYSENENRSLTQRPKLTISSIASGNFMKQYENYQTDQFIGRDFFRMVKVKIDTLSGNKKENGVFDGKKGQLLEDVVVPESESLEKNLSAIKTFRGQFSDVNSSMILAPNAAYVLNNQLPSLASVANQGNLIYNVQKELEGSLNWVDASAVMTAHKDEKIYYKTDHHWTSLGAYYTFQEAQQALGIQGEDETQSATFSPYAVTTKFTGSLASKSGYHTNTKEEIDIYAPKDDVQVLVNQVEEQKKTTSLYQSDKLKEKDKYMVFLGGNYGLLDIKTTANSTKRLIIFKDSYANCFIPFLAPYYHEIVVVDPRYYAGQATELMTTYGITDMLFLYNANTFFEDNNISGVLTGE